MRQLGDLSQTTRLTSLPRKEDVSAFPHSPIQVHSIWDANSLLPGDLGVLLAAGIEDHLKSPRKRSKVT